MPCTSWPDHFIHLRHNNECVRVRPERISHYYNVAEGTRVSLDNGETLIVEGSAAHLDATLRAYRRLVADPHRLLSVRREDLTKQMLTEQTPEQYAREHDDARQLVVNVQQMLESAAEAQVRRSSRKPKPPNRPSKPNN